MAALTQLLQGHGIGTEHADDDVVADSTVIGPPGSFQSVEKGKKRRLDEPSGRSPTTSSNAADAGESDIARLDQVLSYELQERLLNRYIEEILPRFPLIPPTGDCSLPALRCNRPVLLQAIIYAAGPSLLTAHQEEAVARLLLNRISTASASTDRKSFELIQAIHLAAFWFRTPRHYKHVAMFQLIKLGANLAQEIHSGAEAGGMASTFPVRFNIKDEEVELINACRCWLTCHLLSWVMSCLMRQPCAAPWSEDHDHALLVLQYSPDNGNRDKWLSQYLRAEHLCFQVAERMGLTDASTYLGFTDPATKQKVQMTRNSILNWKLMIPQAVRVPTILLWEHVATAYMHESVLHTNTNKGTFSAPFVAENISSTDFTAPLVTQDHITAVYELVSALNNIIDMLTALDTETWLALPAFLYTSRAAYALNVLCKLYVAVTAKGNTLGTVLEGDLVALPQCIDKLCKTGARLRAVDERCGQARILQVADAVREWYTNYSNLLASEAGPLQEFRPQPPGLDPFNPMYMAPQLQTEVETGWQSILQGAEDPNAFDGLDMLFPEPFVLSQPTFDSTRNGHEQ